ncbi:redox-sensing transcriptional repressor Rex [Paenibacillus sp. MMS18-CY102]|uniref:redox-sensing transcriptional repressor Rex n=1 Tax=Paenibacillus sp. MMS18-CY102 TaxID=2682849 RepID=UPI0013658D38|nr:redox-sensing transcriptional repressor Rex [Paenibacillus sp. MMS18-CY102]MWC28507.1 redox-sensing transcriptional repressor Rex [Paenibacillus sp. MMS18-CY102]
MKQLKISEAVVRRLPVYLQVLNELTMREVHTVSSQELGRKLNLNPAQIRKDLAYFGEFGRKGIGYDVDYLIEKIRQILNLDKTHYAALIGAGNLGHALCNYNTYIKDDVQITAVFDANPNKIGSTINGLTVQPMEALSEQIRAQRIRIGIITVPASEAQNVANELVSAGVDGILNFAPAILKVPDEVRIHHANFTTELLSLAYYIENERLERDE